MNYIKLRYYKWLIKQRGGVVFIPWGGGYGIKWVHPYWCEKTAPVFLPEEEEARIAMELRRKGILKPNGALWCIHMGEDRNDEYRNIYTIGGK